MLALTAEAIDAHELASPVEAKDLDVGISGDGLLLGHCTAFLLAGRPFRRWVAPMTASA